MMKRYFVLAALVCLTMGLYAQGFGDMPTSGFSSTSTLMGSGSTYASDPTIDANGMSTMPNRGRTGGNGIFNPDTGDDEEDSDLDKDPITPIGDAVLPLLLLAGIYGFYCYRRRKQA